mmetsp:Transcript_44002/g.102688  ORF Transcript_44002/g.102688 Transcript_44002/m.102688 type:complete len:98 (+) Transcript_44002:157-450(+)
MCASRSITKHGSLDFFLLLAAAAWFICTAEVAMKAVSSILTTLGFPVPRAWLAESLRVQHRAYGLHRDTAKPKSFCCWVQLRPASPRRFKDRLAKLF